MSVPRFQGRVVVITGAASGIGQATVSRFAEEGALLVLNDVDERRLHQVANDLGNDPNYVVVAGDISKDETAQSLIKAALDKFGRIDVLVNNAGIHWIHDIDETTSDDFDHVFAVNLKSMFLCCKHAIPSMLRAKSGVIVNLASISSFVGQEMMGKSTFMYNMTKAGALQLTKSLATRYAANGIRVNCVVPGATRTNQITERDTPNLQEFWEMAGRSHPMGRCAEPFEIANCILFLASDEASFVTGCPFIVDGGYLAR